MRRQPHARPIHDDPEWDLARDLLGFAACVTLFLLVFVVGAVVWARP